MYQQGPGSISVFTTIREADIVESVTDVAFEDLGMEAIYEFTVKDMQVTVAVDAADNNVHALAPLHWRRRIAEERLLQPG